MYRKQELSRWVTDLRILSTAVTNRHVQPGELTTRIDPLSPVGIALGLLLNARGVHERKQLPTGADCTNGIDNIALGDFYAVQAAAAALLDDTIAVCDVLASINDLVGILGEAALHGRRGRRSEAIRDLHRNLGQEAGQIGYCLREDGQLHEARTFAFVHLTEAVSLTAAGRIPVGPTVNWALHDFWRAAVLVSIEEQQAVRMDAAAAAA